MEIPAIKKYMKEHKITYDELAQRTGLSKSCITKIFAGYARYPRVDTMQAIEHALELDQPTTPTSTENRLFELIQTMNKQEVKELSDYVDFLLSKRKKNP